MKKGKKILLSMALIVTSILATVSMTSCKLIDNIKGVVNKTYTEFIDELLSNPPPEVVDKVTSIMTPQLLNDGREDYTFKLVKIENNVENGYVVKVDKKSMATIYTGSYTNLKGNTCLVVDNGGIINIAGGTFTGTPLTVGDRTSLIKASNNGMINIVGGTFKCSDECSLVEIDNNINTPKENIRILGGKFINCNPIEFVIKGYEVITKTIANEDGTITKEYTVQKSIDVTPNADSNNQQESTPTIESSEIK